MKKTITPEEFAAGFAQASGKTPAPDNEPLDIAALVGTLIVNYQTAKDLEHRTFAEWRKFGATAELLKKRGVTPSTLIKMIDDPSYIPIVAEYRKIL